MKKSSSHKAPTIIDVVASILLIFFLHTMLYTWMQIASFKNMLAFYTYNITPIAWTVIVTELIIAVMLFIPRTRVIGFILAAVFATTAIIIIKITPGVPHDFGGIMNHVSIASMRYVIYGLVILLACSGLVLTFIKKPANSSSSSTPIMYS
jgi:hypothetical protein